MRHVPSIKKDVNFMYTRARYIRARYARMHIVRVLHSNKLLVLRHRVHLFVLAENCEIHDDFVLGIHAMNFTRVRHQK